MEKLLVLVWERIELLLKVESPDPTVSRPQVPTHLACSGIALTLDILHCRCFLRRRGFTSALSERARSRADS